MQLVTDNNWKDFAHFPESSKAERIQEINRIASPGSRQEDMLALLERINNEHGIGMDATEVGAMSLLINRLSDIRRFVGDPHVAEGAGDTTGAHCLKVIVESDDIFRGLPYNRVTFEMRQRFMIADLMHDVGELSREFFSFAKEVEQRPDSKAIYDAEYAVAVRATEMAFLATLLSKPEAFNTFINDLRAASGVNPDGSMMKGEHAQTGAQAIASVKNFLKERDIDHYFGEIPAAVKKSAEFYRDKLMHFYNVAEEQRGTMGNAVKLSQKYEGSVQFVRLAGMDGALDYSQATNSRIVSAHVRMEGQLGSILTNAVDLTEQHMLALGVRNKIYDTVIDLVTLNPSILTRGAVDPKTEPKPGSENLQKFYAVLHEDEKDNIKRNPSKTIASGADIIKGRLAADTISQRTALLLYLAARSNRDFVPDSTPLIMKRVMPDELSAGVTLLDRLMRAYIPSSVTDSAGIWDRAWKKMESIATTDAEQKALHNMTGLKEYIHERFDQYSAHRTRIQSNKARSL